MKAEKYYLKYIYISTFVMVITVDFSDIKRRMMWNENII